MCKKDVNIMKNIKQEKNSDYYRIQKDLSELGIKNGDVVLMHSSFKSLGKFEGGAGLFFNAFLDLLGNEGTLIVPSLSFDYVTRENPLFDINETPSCVGYLSEYFRTKIPGVKRSMHATHSCCATGKLAKEITSGHEFDNTPVGKNSPFTKLPSYGGKILMLGCSTRHNTSLHGVEETAEPPYCIDRKNPVEYILKDGEKTVRQRAFRHNFVDENENHVAQRYDRIVELLENGEVARGKVLDADCYLMDSYAVWKRGNEKLMENPFYFVEREF